KLTNEIGADEQPAWTPDGKRIVYRAIEESGTTLKWIAADGSEASGTVLKTVDVPYSGSVSHDGKALVFRSGDSGRWFGDNRAMPMTGETIPRVVVTSPASDIDPQLSSDDRWIAYVSDISGRPETYVRPFDGSGRPIQISSSGGGEPAWSRDGHTIFYRAGRT